MLEATVDKLFVIANNLLWIAGIFASLYIIEKAKNDKIKFNNHSGKKI